MKNKILFVEYPKCSTCRKAKEFLDKHGVDYIDRNIKEEKPTYEELVLWLRNSELPLRRLFNTSGTLYRSLGLPEKLPAMSKEEQLRQLAEDGMLVRRPVLVTDRGVYFGFRLSEWEKAIEPVELF